MIDTKYLLRKAYFQALNGSLSYLGNNVPVYDDVMKLGANDNIYVLMTNSSSSDLNTQQYFASDETFTLEVVMVASMRVNKQVIDSVAGQLLNIVCPNPQQNGLSQQPGAQIDNLYKSADVYNSFQLVNAKSVIRRIITFSQMVTQTSFGDIIPPVPGSLLVPAAMLKFTSADFINATDFQDANLAGYNLAVYYNNDQIFLDKDVDFSILSGGMIRILLPGFDAADANYIFYVSILSN